MRGVSLGARRRSRRGRGIRWWRDEMAQWRRMACYATQGRGRVIKLGELVVRRACSWDAEIPTKTEQHGRSSG